MQDVELEAMTEDEVLGAAEACAEAARRAEVDLLRLAYQWAVLHPADRLDPVESAKPGRERARLLGGPGTPEVTEFAAARPGARIGRSPYAARQLIADALDLHHRHPSLWARVQVWRDPGGVFHLVDHTGTRRLPGTAARPVVVELWRTPRDLRLEIEYDAA